MRLSGAATMSRQLIQGTLAMTDRAAIPVSSLTATINQQGGQIGPEPGEGETRRELFSRLAAVPVRRSTVEGGASRWTTSHIAGAARVNPPRPVQARPAGATVALADGTRVTFAAVEVEEAL